MSSTVVICCLAIRPVCTENIQYNNDDDEDNQSRSANEFKLMIVSHQILIHFNVQFIWFERCVWL